jgi:8-oxo-dGTP diphosphatase
MVDNRERIALQLRDAKPNVNDADCWGVFGGGMRPGEAPGETIVREVQEELGVTLPPTGLRWVKQVVSPLLIRSHVHTYRLHDELENARLREGQKFALVGRDEIQVGGVLQGKRVAPFHLELLEDYWAGKLTDA